MSLKIFSPSRIIAIIILVAAGCGGYWLYNATKKVSVTNFQVVLQETREIDKLYTGVYLVPVLDLQYGELKRDKILNFFSDEKKEVVKAYCIKKYEVYVGYDNLTELLSDKEVIKNACSNKIDSLPEPQILATNSLSGPTSGNYTSDGLCYRWDSDKKQRNDVIRVEMHNSKILDQVNKRGRESLKSLASVFCE